MYILRPDTLKGEYEYRAFSVIYATPKRFKSIIRRRFVKERSLLKLYCKDQEEWDLFYAALDRGSNLFGIAVCEFDFSKFAD